MTPAQYFTPRRLEHTPSFPPGVVMSLRTALVPMVVWRRVPLIQRFQRRLDVLERFLLTMATDLDVITGADVTELLGLPERMLPILAARLVRAQALAETSDGGYEATAITARALRDEAVPDLRQVAQSIVFLPRTADLVAVEDRTSTSLPQWLQDKKVAPTTVAPVDDELHALSRNTLLTKAIAADQVTALPPDIVSIAPDAADTAVIPTRSRASSKEAAVELRRSCDAFLWTGIVVDDTGVSFTLQGKARGRKAGDTSYQPPNAPFRFPVPPGLVAYWQDVLDTAAGPALPSVWRILGPDTRTRLPDVEVVGPSEWLLGIDLPTAEAIAAARRNLVLPFGAALDVEDAVLNVRVAFQPRGRAAAELFAVDKAARVAIGDPRIGVDDAIRVAVQELPAADVGRITPERVRDRLWQLRHYSYLYRLRETEDFGYDRPGT
jgi:hypothetical protein